MVMPLVLICTRNARPVETLLLTQQRQQAKDDRHIAIQLQAHETMTDRISNVLEVHRLALDQHANGDDRIEWCGALRVRVPRHVELCEVRGRAEQVCGGADDAGRARLHLRGGVELLDGVGEFVGARDALNDDVLVLDAGLGEGLLRAVEECVDHGGVPAGVDDANAEAGACGASVGVWVCALRALCLCRVHRAIAKQRRWVLAEVGLAGYVPS